jgi:phenylacetate-CoA ligase
VLFRSEVGDLANIKKEYCSCGRKSKLLGEIYGRCGRLLFSKSGVPISPTMLPVLLYPNLDYNNIDNQKLYNMIDRFQIQQDVNGDLKILLKMKKKEYESYESYKYIIENYKKYFVGSDIKLFFVNEIPRFSSGKEDYVISNFKYNL